MKQLESVCEFVALVFFNLPSFINIQVDILRVKMMSSESGEPRVLSMKMHGFDDDTVTKDLDEADTGGRSSSNNSADSPDSSSRYSLQGVSKSSLESSNWLSNEFNCIHCVY